MNCSYPECKCPDNGKPCLMDPESLAEPAFMGRSLIYEKIESSFPPIKEERMRVQLQQEKIYHLRRANDIAAFLESLGD